MPCYGCVRLAAAREVPSSTLSKNIANAFERHCFECDQNDGYAFESLVEEEADEHMNRTDCGG